MEIPWDDEGGGGRGGGRRGAGSGLMLCRPGWGSMFDGRWLMVDAHSNGAPRNFFVLGVGVAARKSLPAPSPHYDYLDHTLSRRISSLRAILRVASTSSRLHTAFRMHLGVVPLAPARNIAVGRGKQEKGNKRGVAHPSPSLSNSASTQQQQQQHSAPYLL